jgi:hypothetical protein
MKWLRWLAVAGESFGLKRAPEVSCEMASAVKA